MNTIKANYIKTLKEYIEEKIYITSQTDCLEKEIDRNCWWISGTPEQVKSLTKSEWESFLREIINNRKNQLKMSKESVNIIFYCWHDEQAGQLRFNLINSNHQKLPFSCKINFVTLKEVIKEFYSDSTHELVPLNNSTIYDKDNDPKDMTIEYALNVYKETINSN